MQNKNYFEKLNNQIKNSEKPILFWGASLFLKSFLQKHACNDINLLGIIDKDPQKSGMSYGNLKIHTPDFLNECDNVNIIFTILTNSEVNYLRVKTFVENNLQNVTLLPNIFDDEKTIKPDTTTEILNSNIFNNLISNSSWVKQKDFIPTGGAATYTFLYLLFAALEYFTPEYILEFGMGQTSKLTTQYISNKNNSAILHIIEHDKDWINYFSKQLQQNKNIKICHRELEYFDYKGTKNDKYSNLEEITKSNKYNLIIIDGPIGNGKNLSRSNILDLIPKNLAKDFIIIFDDAERAGEKNTINELFKKLDDSNIEYSYKFKQATKRQLIIAAGNCKFFTFY